MLVKQISIAETRPLRHAVLRPHETLEALAHHEPAQAYAVGAFEGERLLAVGFVGRDAEPGVWRVRAMATAPDARGRGAGSAVLEALLAHAFGHGAIAVWCNARTPARRLYERAGFQVTSEEFEIPGIGPHLRMQLRPRNDRKFGR